VKKTFLPLNGRYLIARNNKDKIQLLDATPAEPTFFSIFFKGHFLMARYLPCKLKLEKQCKYSYNLSLSLSLSLPKSYSNSGQNQPVCGNSEKQKGHLSF